MRGTATLSEMAREAGYADATLERLVADGTVEPLHLVGDRRTRIYSRRARFAVWTASSLRRAGASVSAQKKAARFLSRTDLAVRLKRGEKLLVVADDRAFCARADAVFTATSEGKNLAAAFVVVDLAKAWAQFEATVPGAGNAKAEGAEVTNARA